MRPLILRCSLLGCAAAIASVAAQSPRGPIDRQALVERHSPRLTKVDPWAPLSVGNGEFCFTADVTGLQTFTGYYHAHGIATETMARWSWHEDPNPRHYTLDDANRPFTAYGKTLGYPTDDKSAAGQWLRSNPQDYPLPQLALDLTRAGGAALGPGDLSGIDQTLDLWRGLVTSRYQLEGAPVAVVVACSPDRDVLSVRIESPLIASRRLGVKLAFPRGHDPNLKNNPPLDWSQPQSHTTKIVARRPSELVLEESRDASRYFADLESSGPFALEETGPHEFRIAASSGPVLEFTLNFAGRRPEPAPSASEVRQSSAAHWMRFWNRGGAVDFSGSTDPRAAELERRTVLSEYLTAIQFAADFPPQESGLTVSTWYGKHNTEMIWWHTAHFALWGRPELLERNLAWFVRSLPVARALARSRGLRGARWPKMVGPDGRESPGGNPLIVWNQPHPIELAELVYRCEPGAATLARYRDLVLDTAEGMAAMLHWNPAKRQFDLGPPLWIAQEIYDPRTSLNPTFELSYWSRGLQIAQQWRERLGLGRSAEWDRLIAQLAPLPQKDGKYVAMQASPDTWENPLHRRDHPSFLMACGVLPGDGTDRAVMLRTLDAVIASWDWQAKIWGWDYPMIAMTAARLGEPQRAVDILLFKQGPNNAYTAAGHCPQRGDLPTYLPANGALLAAVAMMAAGWDGGPNHDAPGFPRDGSWVVRSEGLRPLP